MWSIIDCLFKVDNSKADITNEAYLNKSNNIINTLRKTVLFVSRYSLSLQSPMVLRIFDAVSLEILLCCTVRKKYISCEMRTSNICECSQYFSEFLGITI